MTDSYLSLSRHRKGLSKMEIWANVIGFEGSYRVSNTGKVYSEKRAGTSGGLLTGFNDKGYRRVLLSKDGKNYKYSVHRLVAKHFLLNIDKKTSVNHIDGNKSNNNSQNLEWCTASENQLHAYDLGLQKANVKEAHKVRHEQTKVAILQFNTEGKFIKEFESIREAAKSIGMSDGTHISAVAKGKRRKCGGYIWKYK